MNYLGTLILLAFIGIVSISAGLLMMLKPALAIEIQRRFYEKINWRIVPISMGKEIRNTRIMGMIIVIISLFVFVVCISCAFGQSDREDYYNSSSGTEKVNIGSGATLMVPKGAMVDTRDGVIKSESVGAFSGRKFEEVEMRLERIEEAQQEMKNKVDELSKIVSTLQEKIGKDGKKD